jgi:predicted transcriptional regulator
MGQINLTQKIIVKEKAGRVAYIQEIALIDKLINWSIGQLENW